jgi:polyferredoxin
MNISMSASSGTGVCPSGKPSLGFGWFASLAVCLPMLLLTALLLSGGPENSAPLAKLMTAVVWFGLNGAFFVMVRTGRTDRIRAALFIAMSLSFVLTFMPNLLEQRGNIALTEVDSLDGKTPFCHIVIPMLLIPAALKQTLIFPGSLVNGFASIGTMLAIWIAASLALGRGWCSWVCFFGGMDEACSRICRKPTIKSLDRRWTAVPLALLITVMLLSAATLSPTYCEWLCPFKSVTEFETVTSFKVLVQTVCFVGLFVGLVIVLPLLTKKRTQCALLCPMGAFQGWTNYINLHRIAIDQAACVQCGLCVKECPTLSISAESIAQGHTLSSCSKCGRCVDVCPKKAVQFHIKGTKLRASPRMARVLFLYPAMLILSAMGSHMMIGALLRIVKLVTTGSLI